MHDFFMEHYGEYLKDNYSDLENMSCAELKEAREIAKTMKCIFDADTQYNIVKAMEEGDVTDVDMSMEEFLTRATKMYQEADTMTRQAMKSKLTLIMS